MKSTFNLKTLLLTFLFVLVASSISPCLNAQTDLPESMGNGNLETWTNDHPDDWTFNAQKGGSIGAESGEAFAFEGEHAALIDTTESEQGPNDFANLSMRIDGRPFRGKTVLFRAAVRTDEIADGGRAQLWFRVDRESDEYLVGAFDNMSDRPITSVDWEHYEIDLRIDDDADVIIVGLLTLGKCKTWFDDASFEIVEDGTPTTDVMDDVMDDDSDDKKAAAARSGMSPVLMKAFTEAENAPRQPFFNHWLWLVAITLGLFALSGWPPRTESKQNEAATEPGVTESETSRPRMVSGFLSKFAFRFSFAYWLLYSFPFPFSGLIPKYGHLFKTWYDTKVSGIVSWAAASVFKIPDELVPPNGSGDTTFSFIQVFLVFVLAIAVASLWSMIDWRKTDYRIPKDLLRSYLRYVLAFWMLSYGLGKVGWGDINQFAVINEYQFNKTWGDSSPMNVVWAFMGTSRAYTIFAGLGEVIGALLIIWRRTATLGALVVFGVMLNVMMLNFCYDVPVKLFSAHLVFMALYVLMPDLRRLANVLFWNRPTVKHDLRPPYTGRVTIWFQRAVKLAIVIFGIAIPTFQHVNSQVKFIAEQAGAPSYFGQYEIEEYKLNGEIVDQADNDYGWRSVRFQRENQYTMEGLALKDKITLGFSKAVGRVDAPFTDSENDLTLEMEDHGNALLPKQSIKLEQLDADRLLLSGEIGSGTIEVTLRRNDNIYRVRDRGFRWINEIPFNR